MMKSMNNRQKKILVIDDSRQMRIAIREELEGGGYQVVEAKDGFEGLVMVSQGPFPDLITLDIEMPRMDGFETCQKLRSYINKIENKTRESIPVIFVTGNDTLEDRKKGFELGATDFVTKPFIKGEILHSVNKILNPVKLEMTALVVDDSSLTRKIISNILVQQGLTVMEAMHGVQGFEIMQDKGKQVDIVITDLIMPEMDGIELVGKIRKDLLMKDLPILILTALSDQEKLLELYKIGASDCLVKPFVKEEFLAKIALHIERHKLFRQLREMVENLKQANEEIKNLSITDALTGCYNRNYMNQQLNKELKRLLRYKTPISIILTDIDHFKKINDTYGHQSGDKILQEFAQAMQNEIRFDLDWIARYGGEEFVIILPETKFEGAHTIAKRLCRMISEREIETEGKRIKITASFGVVGLDEKTEQNQITSETIFAAVDKLLYQAKEEGRNRVCGNKF